MLKQSLPLLALAFCIACNDNTPKPASTSQTPADETATVGTLRHYRGALTGGMKGDSIFFTVSADGKRLQDLRFKGYWYCNGKLEQQYAAGPEGFFNIIDGKVNDHISEPPNGGATAWRFDLSATIDDKIASGTFRMNINALGCNTGTLQWKAIAE